MNLNVYQIILKTVASTVDVLIGIIVLHKGENRTMKMAYSLFCLVNLAGIWCNI